MDNIDTDKVIEAVTKLIDYWDSVRTGNDKWGIREAMNRPLPPFVRKDPFKHG
jgi:hypothetical protein